MKLSTYMTAFLTAIVISPFAFGQDTQDLLRLGVKSCQAFPVNGKTFITAKHCLMNLIPSDFKIALGNENILVKDFNKSEAHDFAELEIASEVSEFFETSSYEKSVDTYLGSSTGNQKIEIMEVPLDGKTLFLHSGSTLPGSSGSPIIQNGKVVGLHVGLIDVDGLKAGVFLPFNRLAEVASLDSAESQAIPAALAAVWGVCVSTPQAATMCVAILGTAASLAKDGVSVIVAYLNSLPDAKTSELQGALKQCEANRDAIIQELKLEFEEARREKNARNNGVIKLEGNPGSTSNPTLPSEIGAVNPDLIELRSVPGGHTQVIARWIAGRWVYYRVQNMSSLSAEFVALARVAFLHKFLSESGRLPSYSEAERGGGVLLSGLDMDSIYRIAITPPAPPVVKPNPGSSSCVVRGCPIER